MSMIRSKSHNVSTYEINKISLSFYDDKRYMLNDGINTLAYGHRRRSEAENNFQQVVIKDVTYNNKASDRVL